MVARLALVGLVLASCDFESRSDERSIEAPPLVAPKPPKPIDAPEPEGRIQIVEPSETAGPQSPTPTPRADRDAGAAVRQDRRCPGAFFVKTCIAGGVPLRTPDGRMVANVGCRTTCSPRRPTGGPAVYCRPTGPRAYLCTGAAP